MREMERQIKDKRETVRGKGERDKEKKESAKRK